MIIQRPGDIILTKYSFHLSDPVVTIANTAIVIWQFFFLLFYYWRRPLTLEEVWTGCLYTHVRLCVEKDGDNCWKYINQTSPTLRYDYLDIIDIMLDLKLNYLQLSPPLSKQFGYYLKKYADNKMGQKYSLGYDYLQLISILVNSILFWWIPKFRGREIIKMFNIRGGHEICSSLAVTMVRYAQLNAIWAVTGIHDPLFDFISASPVSRTLLCKYDAAMVSPCMFYLETKGGFYVQKV